MNKTKIERVKNPDGTQGYTWNPITGCLNGCEYCYARKLANGRLKQRYLANPRIAIPEGGLDKAKLQQALIKDPFYPRFWEERLVAGDAFLKSAKKPLGIFPCDMSDWCGIGIPESWSDWIIEMARRYPQHRIYTLTKQPQNLPAWSPFPDNCWVGVTVTNNFTYIGDLAKVEAKVKYLSIEPLLDWRDFPAQKNNLPEVLNKIGINWLIIGACTGRSPELLKLQQQYPSLALMPYGHQWTLQPRIEWVEEIVRATDKAGVKVFLKDNLGPLLFQKRGLQGYVPSWANAGYGKLKQEVPK